MLRIIIIIGLFLFFAEDSIGQRMDLTLQECIRVAHGESPSSIVINKEFVSDKQNYLAFVRSFYPQITLNGSIPGLNRSINQITLPDGRESFVEQSNLFSSSSLSVTQKIPLTGGQIFLSSGISRIDILGDQDSFFWRANPIEVTLTQPIFQFNNMKWDRQIEDLRMSLSEKEFNEAMERLSLDVTRKFFEVYIAQMNVENSEFNVAINDTLYELSQGRYKVGKIAENDLLQSELALMNARNDLESVKLEFKRALEELKVLLGISREADLRIIPPNDIPLVNVDIEVAINEAMQNRSDIVNINILKLQADQNLEQAEAENSFNANLRASFGLNQTASDVPAALKDLLDQERVNIGFDIPIITFGSNSAAIESAIANKQRIKTNVDIELQNFELDIKYQTLRFLQLKDQVEISAKADTIAQRRFVVAKNRYLISKIDLNTFFIAQNEKDAARRNYIQTLRDYWIAYYDLRRMTMYDFEYNEKIDH